MVRLNLRSSRANLPYKLCWEEHRRVDEAIKMVDCCCVI